MLLASLTAVAVMFVLDVSLDSSSASITTKAIGDLRRESSTTQMLMHSSSPMNSLAHRQPRDSTLKALSSRICGQPAIDGCAPVFSSMAVWGAKNGELGRGYDHTVLRENGPRQFPSKGSSSELFELRLLNSFDCDAQTIAQGLGLRTIPEKLC